MVLVLVLPLLAAAQSALGGTISVELRPHLFAGAVDRDVDGYFEEVGDVSSPLVVGAFFGRDVIEVRGAMEFSLGGVPPGATLARATLVFTVFSRNGEDPFESTATLAMATSRARTSRRTPSSPGRSVPEVSASGTRST
jgi:hypothetical protein